MGLDSIKMLSAEARTKPQKINTLWLVASSAAWSPKGPSIACLRSGIWTSVDFFPSQSASLPQLGPFKNPRVEFPVRREENRIEHIWLRKEKKMGGRVGGTAEKADFFSLQTSRYWIV